MNARIRERPRSRSVESIYEEMGDKLFRRAHGMTYDDFQQLCDLLNPALNALAEVAAAAEGSGRPRHMVENSVRVACAARYFAGGDPDVLTWRYGISEAAVNDSIAMVIHAIHQCDHDA